MMTPGPPAQEVTLGVPAAGAPPAPGKAPPSSAPVPAPAVQAFAVDGSGEGESAERRAASARPAVDASIAFAVLVLVCTVVMLDLIGFLLGALPQLISATAFRCW